MNEESWKFTCIARARPIEKASVPPILKSKSIVSDQLEILICKINALRFRSLNVINFILGCLLVEHVIDRIEQRLFLERSIRAFLHARLKASLTFMLTILADTQTPANRFDNHCVLVDMKAR